MKKPNLWNPNTNEGNRKTKNKPEKTWSYFRWKPMIMQILDTKKTLTSKEYTCQNPRAYAAPTRYRQREREREAMNICDFFFFFRSWVLGFVLKKCLSCLLKLELTYEKKWVAKHSQVPTDPAMEEILSFLLRYTWIKLFIVV